MKTIHNFIICACLGILSCGGEPPLPKSIVPDEIVPYYNSFYAEARKRGVTLYEKPVEIIIVTGLRYKGNTVGGLASRKHQTIQLNRKDVERNNNELNSINLEYLVFHEMGHYVLNRRHNTDTNEDGSLVSMMHDKKVAYTVGKEYLRDYYLDELFDIN